MPYVGKHAFSQMNGFSHDPFKKARQNSSRGLSSSTHFWYAFLFSMEQQGIFIVSADEDLGNILMVMPAIIAPTTRTDTANGKTG